MAPVVFGVVNLIMAALMLRTLWLLLSGKILLPTASFRTPG